MLGIKDTKAMADMPNTENQAIMAEQDPEVVAEEDNGGVGAVPEDEEGGVWYPSV